MSQKINSLFNIPITFFALAGLHREFGAYETEMIKHARQPMEDEQRDKNWKQFE